MVYVSARQSRSKITMARPNEHDLPPKPSLKLQLDIYRTQIWPKFQQNFLAAIGYTFLLLFTSFTLLLQTWSILFNVTSKKSHDQTFEPPSSFPLCHNWIYLCKVFCKGKVSQLDFTAYVLNTSHTPPLSNEVKDQSIKEDLSTTVSAFFIWSSFARTEPLHVVSFLFVKNKTEKMDNFLVTKEQRLFIQSTRFAFSQCKNTKYSCYYEEP